MLLPGNGGDCDGCNEGLDKRIIAAIVVGCIAGVVIIIILIFLIVILVKKKKNKRKQSAGLWVYIQCDFR